MNSSFKHSIILFLVSQSMSLSGCNQYYEQPGYGYNPGPHPGHDSKPGHNPGYDNVSDRRMIKNCKLRVENKVSRKLGYDARVDFGYVDLHDVSRYLSRVKGEAFTSDKNKRLRINYRCSVQKHNGHVTDVDLDWRNKPGHAANKGNAASACKSHISRKVQRETPDRVNFDFRKHDSSGISENRRRVKGNAHVSSSRGRGKIAYECVVSTRHMRVESAHYHWKQKLPAGGHDGYDKDKAKRKCHKAVVSKLNRDGYRGVQFKSTNFQPVGSSDLMLKGKLRMSYQGQNHRARYECRVNGHNGKVKNANYWLDHK